MGRWFLLERVIERLQADGYHVTAPQFPMTARMGATTVEIPSSHVAMVSHPEDVVELIESAAQEVSAAG